MLRFFSSLILALNTVGCATIVEPPVDAKLLKEAILANNIEMVESLLREKSFTKKAFLFFDEKKQNRIYFGREISYSLLKVAISGDNKHHTTICRPHIVRSILSAGLKARPIDLSYAAESLCSETTEVVLKNLSEDEISKGINLFINSFRERLRNQDEHLYSPENAEKQRKIIVILSDVSTKPDDQISLANAIQQIDKIILYPHQKSIDTRNQIQEKYGISFCRNELLSMALFYPQSFKIEENCIYVLKGPFKVFQVVSDGALIQGMESPMQETLFFIKSKEKFFDGQLLQPRLVKFNNATYRYRTVIGADKTILSFQELDKITE